MENPREPASDRDTKRHRGQVVDLRKYQSRRNKGPKTRSSGMRNPLNNHQNEMLRGLCFALLVATAITALLGLTPISWALQALVWSLFLGTVGLGCGLWLHIQRDRFAPKMLILLSAAFVLAYLCSLLHFFVR